MTRLAAYRARPTVGVDPSSDFCKIERARRNRNCLSQPSSMVDHKITEFPNGAITA